MINEKWRSLGTTPMFYKILQNIYDFHKLNMLSGGFNAQLEIMIKGNWVDNCTMAFLCVYSFTMNQGSHVLKDF